MCQTNQLQCVKEVAIIDGECRKGCEGLYVTSYFKSKMDANSFNEFWKKVKDDYMKYKGRKNVSFPDDMKGMFSIESFIPLLLTSH